MRNRAKRAIAASLHKAGRLFDALSARLYTAAPDASRDQLRAIKQNARFKNLHAGRPAFVIGNGPSLTRQDLTPLADQITFVANAFWRHPIMAPGNNSDSHPWCPTYYSIIDPLYIDGSAAMADFYQRLRPRATRSTFFIAARGLSVVEDQALLPMDRVWPCVFWGNVERMRRFSFDLMRPLPHLQSVSLLGIIAALYMGCRPIYLLGMDHDWLSSPNAPSPHFYPGLSVEGHDKVKAIELHSHYTYLENLEGVMKLFNAYEALAKQSKRAGVEIYNASAGGFLDVFPRVDYEQVVSSLDPHPASNAHETAGDGSAAEKADRKTRLAASL